MSARIIMKLRVTEAEVLAPDIVRYSLVHPKRPHLPRPEPGAHVDVRLPDGRVRQYSLCGDPDDDTRYQIAVQLERAGRGGSQWIHKEFKVGVIAHVSAPRNHFKLAPDAEQYFLIGGGIGITPLVAMAYRLVRDKRPFSLHYCARAPRAAAFLEPLREICGDRLVTHWSTAGRLDCQALLAEPRPGAQIYCCGPARLTAAVSSASAAWRPETVHIERFQPLDDDFTPAAFEIEIASTGQRIAVPPERSALEVLRAHGWRPPSSCEIGVCGSCECGYSAGRVIHRDVVLDHVARAHRLMPCVSRAEGRLVLDL